MVEGNMLDSRTGKLPPHASVEMAKDLFEMENFIFEHLTDKFQKET
jgi:hypothetical protein